MLFSSFFASKCLISVFLWLWLLAFGSVWMINLVWAVTEHNFIIRTHLIEMIGKQSLLDKLEQPVIKRHLANVKNKEVIKFVFVECHICAKSSKEKKKLQIDRLCGYYVYKLNFGHFLFFHNLIVPLMSHFGYWLAF